jgi:molecular chaperone GrpE
VTPDADPPEPEPFDAVAAAKELEESLGESPTLGADGQAERYIATLEREIEQLGSLLAQKDELIRRANERAEHAHAEVAAAERRLKNATAKELEQRTRKLLASFLPVLDDLDRAIEAGKAHPQSAELIGGVELVRRELLTQFGHLGVTHAPALGEKFDPVRHEAMALVPVTDPAQDGRVIAVMREGYLIGEDTLRPAGVAVGKHS